MIYPSNFEPKIGFSRIRELVSENCLFEPGKERIAELSMLTDLEVLDIELSRVNEFRELQLGEDEFPIHQFYDNRKALKKAALEGTYLEVEEVFSLYKSLESVRQILRFFESSKDEDYPQLKVLSKEVKYFPFVSERIAKILNRHGHIRDNASQELVRIRKEINEKEAAVLKQMNKLLRKAQKEGWIEEDLGATIRNGRPVIPINASSKRNLGGLIHDESTTGKTVYVEPAEVVEITNRIKELQHAEKREIIRILTDFTDSIRPYLAEINEQASFLAEIDSIRARALFAIKIAAIKPKLEKRRVLSWKKAVHPLLFLALRQSGRSVVPLDIHLDEKERLLLISGPNAGGKSVCLQTVGLLQYMLQCGFLVPVDEESIFGIFDGIFIDIGDEQSIDNDLSTYSSHLVNMKYFLKNAGSESLVLIDEFGTGTEPMLGGAIAEAILGELNEMGTFGVLTTHYTNLKHFAASTEGVINGAMLFDNNKMQPLYELAMGKPGSSFAFEIARKIGLPEEVLSAASEKVGQDHIDFDKHLRDIMRDKKYWERKRDKIRKSEKKLEDLVVKYEEELGSSEKKRKELINEAKLQAEQMLSEANRKIEKTIREIKESNAEKQRTRDVRKELETFRDDLGSKENTELDKLASEYRRMKDRGEELMRRRPDIRKRSVQQKPAEKKEEQSTELQAGDHVKLEGQDTVGEVLEVKGKEAQVAFGNLKSRVKLSKLQKVILNKQDTVSKSRINLGDWNVSKRRASFRPEIDIRGKRAEDGIRLVTEFIDEAIMLGSGEIRILHGKGDGILRQLVREQLAVNDVVDWFGDEHIERGGAGITVVRFAY